MNLLYEPKKLRNVSKKIARYETKVRSIEIKKCDELQKLVESVVNLEKIQVKYHMMALSDKEVCLLAGYIPHNYWNYELVNFTELFRYRATKQMFEILFREWQEVYDRKYVNEFIVSLPNVEQYSSSFLKSVKHEENTFLNILKQDDVIKGLVNLLNKQKFSKDVSLEMRITSIGIYKESFLYEKINYLFYVYCDKESYLCRTNLELFHILERYKNDKKNIIKVIENMFLKMNFEEIKKYRLILFILRKKINPTTNLEKLFEQIENCEQIRPTSLKRIKYWTKEERIMGDKLISLLKTYYYEEPIQLENALYDIIEGEIGKEVLVDLEKIGIMHEIEKSDIITESLLDKYVMMMKTLEKDKIMSTKMGLVWLYAYGVKILGLQSEIMFD